MRAVRVDEFVKEYDEIKVLDVPNPRPKDGEVIVQIVAAGVNFVDLLYSRGKHQNNHRGLVKPPFILGLEFAGIIVHAAPNSSFKPGDRVFGGSLGSYAQLLSVKESALHPIPAGWSFAAAAGLGATAPVSYGALVTRGYLKKGETVLVHAAAGGLGLMAVQIAKAVGARVIATAGSEEKLQVARNFGADECINYRRNEWWVEVLKLTNGQGVDVVYDSVGLVDKSLKCVKHKGRILIVGFAGAEGDLEKIAMNRVLLKQAILIGYRFGETDRRDPSETKLIWQGLKTMWEAGLLKPTVYEKQYIGLESVVTAMKDLSERKVWGKAVIQVDADADAEKSRL